MVNKFSKNCVEVTRSVSWIGGTFAVGSRSAVDGSRVFDSYTQRGIGANGVDERMHNSDKSCCVIGILGKKGSMEKVSAAH